MIALVTGAPGAGKSYYAVRVIADALMQGKPVATNIELRDGWERRIALLNPVNRIWPPRRRRTEAKLRSLLFVSADLDELFRVRLAGTGESRGLMALDEAHNWANARTWDQSENGRASKGEAVKARLQIVRYFSQHRKLGWDVYCITQDAQNIDRQIRSLFEYHIKLKPLHRAKIAGIPITLGVKFFLAIWTWNDGAKTIVKRQGYPLTSIRQIYDTLALSHGLEDDVVDPIRLPREPVDAPERARDGLLGCHRWRAAGRRTESAGRPRAPEARSEPDHDQTDGSAAAEPSPLS